MATKQFAIPLNSSSKQTGDITFEALAAANATVDFKLTNVTAGMSGNQLNLITNKSGAATNHIFMVTFSSGDVKATLSAAQIDTVYNDANGGDWDYVEANWTIGSADTPSGSVNYEILNSVVYDRNGWPPKTS